jgi:hypothetical protein
MHRVIILKLGSDTVRKKIDFRSGVEEKDMHARACKRYSSIVNAGGTVEVLDKEH